MFSARILSQRIYAAKPAIVVRSTYIRCLHDIVMLCSFGADAVNPYAMLSIAADVSKDDPSHGISNLLESLQVGLEKVISTIGSHELRGYGRVASSIGLAPELAGIFHTPNFLGSHSSGLTLASFGRRRAVSS